MKYLRLKIFKAFLKPFSEYARKRRTEKFIKLMKPKENMKVLDIGGQPKIWDNVGVPLKITCLNLPGIATTNHPTHHEISYVEGDGCNMPEFNFGEFDLVFSNSVIEHVGDCEKRKLYAKEIQRLSNSYWIQTPYKYYPLEAHCGMPFWWFYPKSLRSLILERWRKKLPAWTEMVEGTDVVSPKEIETLFPKAEVMKEWLIFPKSIIAYSNAQQINKLDNPALATSTTAKL